MVAKLTFLNVAATFALMTQAAPVARPDTNNAPRSLDRAKETMRPRGIQIPWKWVGPSILGTVTLDHLGFHNPNEGNGQPIWQQPTGHRAQSSPQSSPHPSPTSPTQNFPPPPSSPPPSGPNYANILGASTWPAPADSAVPAIPPGSNNVDPPRTDPYWWRPPRPDSSLGKRPTIWQDPTASSSNPPQQRNLAADEIDQIPRTNSQTEADSKSAGFVQSDEQHHERRGITIPWRWVGPSIAGTVALDALLMDGTTPTGGESSSAPINLNAPPGSQGQTVSPVVMRDEVNVKPLDGEAADLPAANKGQRGEDASVGSENRRDELSPRGNIRWAWVLPSVFAGATIDHILSHSFMRPHNHPQASIPAHSSPQIVVQPSPQPVQPSPQPVQPSPHPYGTAPPSSRGLQEEGMGATLTGYQRLSGSMKTAASKVPFKAIGLGLVGGAVLDHVLPPFPTPYFHLQPNLRLLDNDNIVSVGTKRSELQPRFNLPWKWILGGAAGGFTLDKLFT
ncbi:hypothetical protein CF319_g1968 [Tilletia indica]|nr:hypothetical protein CF319_g1968 [Tilletia indica]